MYKINTELKNPEQRRVFVDTLIEVMKENDKVYALEADLGAASLFDQIGKAVPERYCNVGIAEANMMGIAAGLSLRGNIPFAHSFTPFASRRSFDQIFLCAAYAKTTLNIYASDPGICVAINGGTHTSFEDIAMFRAVPDAMIFDPADGVQLNWLIKELISLEGLHYIRSSRKSMPSIYDTGSTFEIGKANTLREGFDILIVAMGETLAEAYKVAKNLETQGISCTVIDMFTVKPLDRKSIINHSKGKKLIVTAENHNINNGLGSAVAEVIAEENLAVPLLRLGIIERFGQVGPQEYLRKDYRLDYESLKEDILKKYNTIK